MALNVTRRDLLKLAGGSALGLVFSPVPYKVLDDSAIWTQNWRSIPRLAHGPVSYRYAACTLCPAGCALKARCVGGSPVSLSGLVGHPLSKGMPLPGGTRRASSSVPSASSSRCIPVCGKRIRRLDPTHRSRRCNQGDRNSLQRRYEREVSEGRSPSSTDSRDVPPRWSSENLSAAFPEGMYVVPSSREDLTLAALRRMAVTTIPELGFDLERVRTVLSFNAPVLDGWGTPARFCRHSHPARNRAQHSSRSNPVHPGRQRGPMRGSRFRPGTEAPLALCIGRLLIRTWSCYPRSCRRSIGDFEAYVTLTRTIHSGKVSLMTGIDVDRIISLATRLLLVDLRSSLRGATRAEGRWGGRQSMPSRV